MHFLRRLVRWPGPNRTLREPRGDAGHRSRQRRLRRSRGPAKRTLDRGSFRIVAPQTPHSSAALSPRAEGGTAHDTKRPPSPGTGSVVMTTATHRKRSPPGPAPARRSLAGREVRGSAPSSLPREISHRPLSFRSAADMVGELSGLWLVGRPGCPVLFPPLRGRWFSTRVELSWQRLADRGAGWEAWAGAGGRVLGPACGSRASRTGREAAVFPARASAKRRAPCCLFPRALPPSCFIRTAIQTEEDAETARPREPWPRPHR